MKWINVKDRLPEIGAWVLATQHEYKDTASPRYYYVLQYKKITDCDKVEHTTWTDGEYYSIENELYAPSHWMPLPEPPSQKPIFDQDGGINIPKKEK